MPLSGPNIKKLKESGDIDALIPLLKSDNLQRRVEAFDALAEMGDQRANEVLVKEFTDIFRFGEAKDKVLAITIMRGDTGPTYSGVHVWGVGDFSKVKLTRKLPLNLVGPILLSLATSQGETPAMRWYAVVALLELGDRSNEVMQLLTDTFNEMPKKNIDVLEAQVRALSYIEGSSTLVDWFIQVQKGEVWRGGLDVGWRSAAIYALAATGDPLAREHLEYLASHGDQFFRTRAQAALKLFGKATYDEIEAAVEAEKRAKEDKGKCFIATAVYGDTNAPEVRLLRRFRDEFLLPFLPGRLLVSTYYLVSPMMITLVQSKGVKSLVKCLILKPMLWIARERISSST